MREDPKGFAIVILIGVVLTFLAVGTLATCAQMRF